ncbi:MAG TPA: hypothetical protein VK281_20635 [Xanthobacteraceae bacterium]|nr:hypothetical protein [Xanthobacteraceae bacterium]
MAISKRLAPADAALVVASALFGYLLVEAGYRLLQYRAMLRDIVAAATVQIPTDGRPSSVYDPFTGYRYRPNIEVGPATAPFPVHYRTNSHGLIAREDFPLAKPAGEYRIGVVGDSFTADVTSTLRWTDVVEDTLNASGDWQAIVSGRRTRVINFGLDGIGTVQFGAVAERVALPFDLDLLIVNMIKNDLIRRPHIRRDEAAISPADMSDYVRTNIMNRLNWFTIHPEVLAVVAGPYLELTPRLTLDTVEATLSQGLYYTSAEEAAPGSVAAIETILGNFPAAVFLLDSTYPELIGAATSTSRLEDEVFAALHAQLPSVAWTNVIVGDRAPRSRAEIDGWFNVPSDQHRSDAGVRAYGAAVAAHLINRSRH